MAHHRIMYLEIKNGPQAGEARIGRVTFSKSGRSIYYQGQRFASLNGRGHKANYFEVATKIQYWISGPKKDGTDRLYGERVPIHIDTDVQEEYWTTIRQLPEMTGTLIRNR
ncbi:MAG: 1-deoxy-D-xylulose-5-phosphate synthase [Bacteroidota bacterium]